MNEDCEEQVGFELWVSQELRIVTFREADGYEKRTFRTQEEKMEHVCDLCETGYRIL